jgi:hypothetical protein
MPDGAADARTCCGIPEMVREIEATGVRMPELSAVELLQHLRALQTQFRDWVAIAGILVAAAAMKIRVVDPRQGY